MGKLLARWGVEESGTSGTIRARAQLKGLGDTVRESLATANGRIAVIIPKGTMWARNIQLSELDVGVFIQKMFEKSSRIRSRSIAALSPSRCATASPRPIRS